jgi:hypothetical protein
MNSLTMGTQPLGKLASLNPSPLPFNTTAFDALVPWLSSGLKRRMACMQVILLNVKRTNNQIYIVLIYNLCIILFTPSITTSNNHDTHRDNPDTDPTKIVPKIWLVQFIVSWEIWNLTYTRKFHKKHHLPFNQLSL